MPLSIPLEGNRHLGAGKRENESISDTCLNSQNTQWTKLHTLLQFSLTNWKGLLFSSLDRLGNQSSEMSGNLPKFTRLLYGGFKSMFPD